MKLLTKELEQRFAKIGYQGEKETSDVIVIAHFFIGKCDWWATEYLPEDRVFFGYACLNDPEMAELGYFSLDELQGTKIMGIFSIERDLYWQECSLKKVIEKVKSLIK